MHELINEELVRGEGNVLLLAENFVVAAFSEVSFQAYRYFDVNILELFNGDQLNLSVVLRNPDNISSLMLIITCCRIRGRAGKDQ
jgi:hypothetical protein